MSIASITTEGFVSDRVNGLMAEGFATYSGLPEPPPTSYQYQTYVSGGTGNWLGAGASPAIVAGDVFLASLITGLAGYQVQINDDGTVNILAGGDTSRQSFGYSYFRVSTNQLDPGGIGTVWVNEIGPIWHSLASQPAVIVNVPIAAVNYASAAYAVSPEGDTLGFSVASGALPIGLTLSLRGILTGTPSVLGVYNFTINATDFTGTATASGASQIGVQNSPLPNAPNVVGLTQAAAIAAIEAAGLVAAVTTGFSTVLPAGYVSAQSPVGGTPISSGATLTIVVSLGPYVAAVAPTSPGPRVWGRNYNPDGSYVWVAVTPDANGSQSYLNITWLIQVLKLNLAESPLYANYGIPAQQSVVTQIFPDYYVQQVQQQFSPFFASLQITKVAGPSPVYNVAITTFEGTIFNEDIPV